MQEINLSAFLQIGKEIIGKISKKCNVGFKYPRNQQALH